VGGEQGEQQDLRRHLLCLDRSNGQTIWSKEVAPELPEDEYGGMFAQHGYASHTPVSDGDRVYCFFGKTGVIAFDMDGNQLWHTKVGSGLDQRGWGSASSPILHGDLVIVTASAESHAMIALNKNDGKEVWRKEAEGFGSTWGTPVLVKIDEERTDLVLGVPYEFWGFDPQTGKLRWFCESVDNNSYCSSVITDGNVVHGIEGRGGGSIAVKAGGEGDVTKSHVVWNGRDNNRIGTPLLHDGRIYFISGGIASCTDAASGEQIYRERLARPEAPAQAEPAEENRGERQGRGGRGGGGMGGQDYSSPVAADGKLYYTTRSGEIYVLKLGAEFEQLSVNRVTTDREDFSATPALADGQLFIRSDKHLYCVAK
jgi:outer membrane protein assembly factor BamB